MELQEPRIEVNRYFDYYSKIGRIKKMKKTQPTRSQSYRPANPLQMPRFGGICTFSRLPYVPNIAGEKIDVAILGIPFDGGTTFRPGARFGPRALREASVLCRNFNPDLNIDVYEKLQVIDAGDVAVNPLNLATTSTRIQKKISELHQAGARVISLGGDHSILLACLRAVHQRFGEFTLIHFDAHTDTADQAWGEKYHHGTPIRRAIEEGLIQGPRIFQIGIRGPLSASDQNEYLREQKIQVLDMESFHQPEKRDRFFSKILKTAGQKPCYLTFDIDGIDPAYAPGTGTPVVGGLTSLEALQCVRKLRGIHLVGADLVEVSPPYDQSELTSLLGSALVFEFLSLMALKK
ncbi:MAG: agmatinase [Bdellovibrionia bacterium]